MTNSYPLFKMPDYKANTNYNPDTETFTFAVTGVKDQHEALGIETLLRETLEEKSIDASFINTTFGREISFHDTNRLIQVDGNPFQLTPKLYSTLRFLFDEIDKDYSTKESIINAIYHGSKKRPKDTDRVLRNYTSRLNKFFKENGINFMYIANKKGEGYRLENYEKIFQSFH